MTRTASMILGMAAALLGACSSSDAPSDTAASTAATQAAGPAAEFTAGVPIGGKAAPAKLQFRLGAIPVVGASVPVSIRVTPTSEVDKVQVFFEAEPGLAFVDDAQSSFVTDHMAAGATHSHELQIRPEQVGVHLLNVTVMTDVAGVSKATTFAIPLIVGTAEAPAKPAATPATGG